MLTSVLFCMNFVSMGNLSSCEELCKTNKRRETSGQRNSKITMYKYRSNETQWLIVKIIIKIIKIIINYLYIISLIKISPFANLNVTT